MSGELVGKSACDHAGSVAMTSPSGAVVVNLCVKCTDWRIVLASGHGLGDLRVAMEDVGERLSGPARIELLNLAGAMRDVW